MQAITFLGNNSLLDLPKTAFLSSRRISPEAVLRCYDWAIAQRELGTCIISGFHSALEKDVLRILLKGQQPIVLVLARRLYSQTPKELDVALNDGRLLIVSTSSDSRASESTTRKRNEYIVSHADHVAIGALTSSGSLATLVATLPADKILQVVPSGSAN